MENEKPLFVFEGRGAPEAPLKPSYRNLSAVLSCLGAQVSESGLAFIRKMQNPYSQKRGGLGFGCYANVKTGENKSDLVNINVFAKQQATFSPLLLEVNEADGTFEIYRDSQKVSSGKILPVPDWGKQILSTGKPAIAVLQQHGAENLQTILGKNRCELFDDGSACKFCAFDGGENNQARSVEEVLEAYNLAAKYRPNSTLTVTCGLLRSNEAGEFIRELAKLKAGMGNGALALEIAPFTEDIESNLQALKAAGLDTLMIPLDCVTESARKKFLAGKAEILRDFYWPNVEAAVKIFGEGNVTSNLIIGLDPPAESFAAIRNLIAAGVVPEPIPVRWDDTKFSEDANLPFTDPEDLLVARSIARIEWLRRGVSTKVKAGCAACGGCGGFSINKLK